MVCLADKILQFKGPQMASSSIPWSRANQKGTQTLLRQVSTQSILQLEICIVQKSEKLDTNLKTEYKIMLIIQIVNLLIFDFFLDLLWYPIQFFLKFILVRPFHFYGYPFPKGASSLLKFIHFFYNWTWKVLLLFVNHYQKLVNQCRAKYTIRHYFIMQTTSISFEIFLKKPFHFIPNY